jgi:hypothetical protein
MVTRYWQIGLTKCQRNAADGTDGPGQLTYVGLIQLNIQNLGSGHVEMLPEQKRQAHATLDQAVSERSVAQDRALQLCNDRRRANSRVARYADSTPTQAFDKIMPARGLDVNQGTRFQGLAIQQISGSHKGTSGLYWAIQWPLVGRVPKIEAGPPMVRSSRPEPVALGGPAGAPAPAGSQSASVECDRVEPGCGASTVRRRTSTSIPNGNDQPQRSRFRNRGPLQTDRGRGDVDAWVGAPGFGSLGEELIVRGFVISTVRKALFVLVVGISNILLPQSIAKLNSSGVPPGSTFVVRSSWNCSVLTGVKCWNTSLKNRSPSTRSTNRDRLFPHPMDSPRRHRRH